MINRRELLLLLGGAMAVAPDLRAQQKAMPVIGFLGIGSPGPVRAPYLAAFREGLSETAYIEGQNLAVEYRWAEGSSDRLPPTAADLVGRKVDVIVTRAAPCRHWRRKPQPRPSRSSSPAATRSSTAWSPVSPGRAGTSPASRSSSSSWCPSG